MSTTRGGPGERKAFRWRYVAESSALLIENEKGKCHEFALAEIHELLGELHAKFTTTFFPLANNVAKLGDGTERAGLGSFILRQKPGDVTHAQGASYLGAVLEECGILQWNGKCRGIEWRLLETNITASALAARLGLPRPLDGRDISRETEDRPPEAPQVNGHSFRLRFPAGETGTWSSRYDYGGDDEIESVISPRAQAAGYLTKADFLRLCNWKSPRTKTRCAKNTDALVLEATKVSFSAVTEPLRIGVLTLLAGVDWPTASAILHFCHSDPYPILDFRALWSLGVDPPPTSYRFDFWWDYVLFCRALADASRVPMRTLDRALWQYSRENQSRS